MAKITKKLDDSNSVWNDFGVLKDVKVVPNYVIIENDAQQFRKMSIKKYKQSAVRIGEKAEELKGQRVQIRTSQATKAWSDGVWFSDIKAL